MIDSHVHVGAFRISSPKIYGWMNISIDDLLKYMKDFGVDKSWLLSHPNTVEGYVLGDDETVLETAASYPELIPFCTPSSSEYIPLMVKAGCRGIGEIKVERPINDPKLMAIYKEAGEYGLSVIIHTTDKHCYGSLNQFNEVFGKNPKTNFVMHGWGWWNLYGDDMKDFLYKFDNVFMDISANSGFKTLWNKFLTMKFLETFSNRILYGTDFPMLTTYDGTQFGVNQHHFQLIYGLSQKVKDNIFFKNAERLIK